MSIAQRPARNVEATVSGVELPTLSEPARRPLPGSLGDVPAQDAMTPAGRLRRCTFRRVDRVAALPQRPERPTYEVMCLYVGPERPLALGDLPDAGPVCEACTASGVFRPDED